ncbi:MAG: DUF4988 domain-containing protein, partial [Muribaculaceae bacterium]|nr:DUF4988 domain-containing protein [Muribaculaceae bacterium]
MYNRIDQIDARLSVLESKANETNSNISALRQLCEAVNNNFSIAKVETVTEGYRVTLSNGDVLILRHGKDGQNGTNGKDGADGKDGKDAPVPVIAVTYDDATGTYYWTIDGTILTDAAGNPIPVTGKDGKDGADGKDGKDGANGKDGQDGKDAPLPVIKIGSQIGSGYVADAYYLSVDEGKTWTRISGADGKSFFNNVSIDENAGKVILELADGSIFEVPYVKDFILAFSETEGEFTYGESREVEVTSNGVVSYQISKPDGWKAKYTGGKLVITAPAADNK